MADSERIKSNQQAPQTDTQDYASPARDKPPRISPIQQIQQTIGNRALARLIQAKLTVSQPGDVHEQEADRVADQIMRMPDRLHERQTAVSREAAVPEIQRKCTDCEQEKAMRKAEDEEEEEVQAKEASGSSPGLTQATEASISSVRKGGEPLGASVRSFFEPRFGHDFSQVRVHTDEAAAASARAIGALAYTVGSDVVFRSGQYAPDTSQGRRLLAHELTHVVQQNGGANRLQAKISSEEEADEADIQNDITAIDQDEPEVVSRTVERERLLDTESPTPVMIARAPDAGVPPAPPPAAAPCVRPVKPKSTQKKKDLDFGMLMWVNWESSTGTMGDLAGCFVTENIKYSAITNPPFGGADGKALPESGKTQRIPAGDGVKAEAGVGKDTHRHPRDLVRSPASTGSYTVTQSYDYKSPACGGKWIPFANYVITYKIYNKAGSLRFSTHKDGTDGPFDSDEAI